jgi:RND superfamily putative drug exporter
MLVRIAKAIAGKPKWFLMGIIAFLAVAGPLGGSVVDKLVNGGFEDAAAESSVARERLQADFAVAEPNLVLLVTSKGEIDSSDATSAGTELTKRLAAEPGIGNVLSYWTANKNPALKSRDGTSALVLARVDDSAGDPTKRIADLRSEFGGERDGLTVGIGGSVAASFDTDDTIQKNLQAMELIALPVMFLVLLLVFGSLVSATLPLIMVLPMVVGTLFILRLIAGVTDVSIFAMNTATVIGLGLAVDYSLFIVSRYREELRHRGGDITNKADRSEAIVAAVRTAGRTVVFSAVTVALASAALAVFPLVFLRSIAYAGIAVSGFAALSAIILMPTLLALFGSKINSLDLRKGFRKLFGRPAKVSADTPDEGVWYRIATAVMRFPIPVATIVVAVLLLLGSPFLGAKFSLPDDRQLPASAESRQVQTTVREGFDSREADVLTVVAGGVRDEAGRAAQIQSYAEQLSRIDGVASVTSSAGTFTDGRTTAPPNPGAAAMANENGTFLKVAPDVEPYSAEGERLVADLRAAQAPWPVLITGTAAALVDTMTALDDGLPIALLFIGLSTFLLLFLFTGSILLPFKALLLNLLSLSATFGAMVWIFQEGNLASLFGVEVTGTTIAITPILMFCLLFGLSMDYEVFMLSRIKEEYERTGNTQLAVARGLGRTGRIVTAAAGLMMVVTISNLITTEIGFQVMFGFGLTLALFMDAFVVRGLLLPAFMQLAGRANWWAPGPLRRLHRRFGLSEEPAVVGTPVKEKSLVG